MEATSRRPPTTVRGFCIYHKLYAPQRSAEGNKIYTHLDLSGENGGTINVPDALHSQFLDIYADDVARGEPLYLTEQRTDPFRMFFDIDLQIAAAIRPEDKLFARMFCDILRDLRRFYPLLSDRECQETLRCIITSSPDKPMDGGIVKVGYHLHFPGLVVDKQQALLMHASAVCALSRATRSAEIPPELADSLNWGDALDACVYETNGLRMLGSDKASNCPACKNSAKKVDCTQCDGMGKIAQDRPYMLMCVIAGTATRVDREFTQTIADSRQLIAAVSIRSMAAIPTPGFLRYEGSPPPFIVEKRTNKRDHIVTAVQHTDFTDDAAGIKNLKDPKNTACRQTVDRDVLAAIASAIRVSCPVVYARVELKKATYKDKTKQEIWATVTGEGSSFCQNVDRDHTGNTIYFHITRDGIAQRCFSSKNNAARCPCRTYASQRKEVPRAIVDIIFPPKAAELKKRAIVTPFVSGGQTCAVRLQIKLSGLSARLEKVAFQNQTNHNQLNQDQDQRRNNPSAREGSKKRKTWKSYCP